MVRMSFAIDEFYHIYNRGTDKRNIFSGQVDYDRFISLLYFCNSEEPVDLKLQGPTLAKLEKERGEKPLVDITAYCLMPNHFHLLIKENQERGISRFVQKLTTGYTMYFNKRHERSGVLFQGKFKATHVAEDRYLKYLISYIHLNPVKLIEPAWKETGISNKERAKKYVEEYHHSSYREFRGFDRTEKIILNMHALPKYFDTPKDFETSVTEWLNYSVT